jgi:hypothetical protein
MHLLEQLQTADCICASGIHAEYPDALRVIGIIFDLSGGTRLDLGDQQARYNRLDLDLKGRSQLGADIKQEADLGQVEQRLQRCGKESHAENRKVFLVGIPLPPIIQGKQVTL